MTPLRWIAAIIALGYLAVVATLFVFQRALLYPVPQTIRVAPAAAGFPAATEVELATTDGERIVAWHVPPKPGKPVVLFFHGNGEVLAWRVARFRAIVADGTGLLAVSFRGYGGSSGSPTEDGLLRDADAAYAFATAKYAPERLVPWGYSLGSGVAVALATTRPVGRLILEAPYTSIVEVAAGRFPWLPVRWLMRDRFASDQRMPALKAPLLIMHGERDEVVPFALGQWLYALAPEPKQFVAFAGGTHVNLDQLGALDVVRRFLAEMP
ncbi:alpha/beta fold hydrolase [Bradyrhizobium sp. U87765 SZCCT0131]|uniref:alpha/beta hydrolase n=1 Tax=unclassified Bradyrhizobium TaxID=2631580 RepID=UPI001BA5E287|nr:MULTISPECIES: alpha/beta fold hydrolase [unclassified Bradyrhizobium]MBR1221925.1 alpha/beta fold hydrolase [Bradyrhizobium sp. U87765 SZCCT0131]MBR1263877.1 alpha/beta fold hydrolase [Bradyrhizobium sp. U87765 SZCCT0134]MBR1302553.1 alpha/beta fold hydrolase [Bradyrhizobium sp. U87765 SZCCT0110]MBR1320127.1 alpha/beta fold hydrolase [Bradyrhizobium sp. U87765 SZCCT0109]MBR1348760.1 alpha/beta fold hydrolase [Bradyrhizobium sp. U87765 SZCCT0048]